MRAPLGVLLLGIMTAACGAEVPAQQPPHGVLVPVVDPPIPPAPVASLEIAPPVPPLQNTAALQQQKQQETLGLLAEAMNAHDAKKLASAYVDGAAVKVVGQPDAVGRDAIAADAQKLFDAVSNFKYHVAREWTRAEVVVTEWVATGTHSGEFLGARATEKPVGWTALSVLSFAEDGLIKEQRVYWDPSRVLLQIGADRMHILSPIPALPLGKPETYASDASPEESKNSETVKELVAASNARDEDRQLALYAETLERWNVGTGGPSLTKGFVKTFHKTLRTSLPDVSETVTNLVAAGPWVIAETALTGTQTTKKIFRLNQVHVYELKNAKIERDWSYVATSLKNADSPVSSRPPVTKSH